MKRLGFLLVLIILAGHLNIHAVDFGRNNKVISDSLPFLDFLGKTINGKCYSTVVKDTILYEGIGNKLAVYNIVDKSQPQLLDTIDLIAYSMQLKGNYLFAAGNNISILDISDPSNPVVLDSISYTSRKIILSGDYLYSLNGNDDHIELFNVKDVNNPYFVAQSSESNIKTFSKSKNCLYVIFNDYGATDSVYIMDVSDSLNMHIIGSVDSVTSGNGFTDMFSDTNYLYVAYDSEGIVINIYGVSDEYDPQYISSVPVPYSYDIIRKIYVDGNYLYYASDEYEENDYTILNGLVFIADITDKSNPSVVGEISGFKECSNLYAKNGFIYLSDTNYNYMSNNVQYGIEIINDTIKNAPVIESRTGIIDSLSDMAVLGNYLFVNDDNLYYYAINDSMTTLLPKKNGPIDFGNRIVNSYIKKLFSNENYLGVSYYNYYDDMSNITITEGIHIYEKSDSTPATLYSDIDIPGTERYFFLYGNYIYILGGDSNGLHIVDIDSAKESGFLAMSSYSDICVYGNYAYVISNSDTLNVIDVTDKTNPHFILNMYIANTPVKLFAYKNYLYVATQTGGVRILDISNINDIHEVGHTVNFGSNKNIYVLGNYLYEADGNLNIFDISDKTNPVLYTSKELDGRSYTLAVNKDYIFIGSMYVFKFNNSTGIFQNIEKKYENVFCKQVGDKITIYFSVKDYCHAEFSIYDIQGRKIKELVRGDFIKGSYSKSCSINNFPKGTYFIRGKIGRKSSIIKKIYKL